MNITRRFILTLALLGVVGTASVAPAMASGAGGGGYNSGGAGGGILGGGGGSSC